MKIPKTKLQKKKDNNNSTYWLKKADGLWGKLIHLQGLCAVCGRKKGFITQEWNETNQDYDLIQKDYKLEAHHIVSRAVRHLRHDPENGLLLCSYHHKYSPDCSPHAGPIGFSEWLKEHYPAKFELALTKRYSTGKPDYKKATEKLEQLIREW